MDSITGEGEYPPIQNDLKDVETLIFEYDNKRNRTARGHWHDFCSFAQRFINKFRHWHDPRKHLAISTLTFDKAPLDALVLHAGFQVLVDFMEKEQPYEQADWNTDEETREAWEKLQKLYWWWKDIGYGSRLDYYEANDKLCELIHLRAYLHSGR